MRIAGIALLLSATVLAQGHHRKENRALLGIVTAPVPNEDERTKVVVLHVLEKSPAAKAKLKKGDEVVSIGGTQVSTPQEVDAALAGYKGKEKVAIEYRRDGKSATANAKLIERAGYKGDFLKTPRRGATGISAPEWFTYGWAQAGEAPPTLEDCKKKVVVIHCFQSW